MSSMETALAPSGPARAAGQDRARPLHEVTAYLAPRRLDEALQAMADGDATVLCGGTDLAPQTESGTRRYRAKLLNIRRVAGLGGIAAEGDEVRIGAATTITEIRRDPGLARIAPVLVEAAEHFASEQIRNAASVGGNICNASPAGDMIPPLLVLGAWVELACWQDGAVQTRRVALERFFVGPGKTVKRPEELLKAVVFARPAADFVARFRKSGPRPALEISTVSVAIGARVAGGRLSEARVAMGSVAPTPLRARHVEAALEGKPLDAATIAAAVAATTDDVKPIDDVRASAWYRGHLARVFVEEVLHEVRGN
ncbi:FAD binding domain-containing protein [Ramlibacter lithotrophicus]|uniref:FAD binding domain-containing protein n=1 Tax=Ramlibacter lithotrophicus TaxID=2606681 RepID=UPI00192D43CB|nr:xanthine dehydrogenase family protein subunit M [Ramlibacter lithotrophicus]